MNCKKRTQGFYLPREFGSSRLSREKDKTKVRSGFKEEREDRPTHRGLSPLFKEVEKSMLLAYEGEEGALNSTPK